MGRLGQLATLAEQLGVPMELTVQDSLDDTYEEMHIEHKKDNDCKDFIITTPDEIGEGEFSIKHENLTITTEENQTSQVEETNLVDSIESNMSNSNIIQKEEESVSMENENFQLQAVKPGTTVNSIFAQSDPIAFQIKILKEETKELKLEETDLDPSSHKRRTIYPKLKKVKPSDLGYSCTKCDMAPYKTWDGLKRHQLKTHEGFTWDCDQCDKKFFQSSRLYTHMRFVHQGLSYDCDMCEKPFRTAANLAAHKETEGKKCPTCFFIFCNTDVLIQHKRTHDPMFYNGVFNCDKCKFVSKKRVQIKAHIRTVHERFRPFECDQCDFKTKDRSNVMEHKKVVHDGFRYECVECNIKFKQKVSFEKHTEREHENNEYPCEICDFKGKTRGILRDHVRKVHEDTKRRCPLCGIEVSYNASMRRHMMIHEGIKQKVYSAVSRPVPSSDNPLAIRRQCVVCSEIFEDHKTFMKHRRLMHPKEDDVDEAESEVLCTTCPNIFPGQAAYKKHRKACSRAVEKETTITKQKPTKKDNVKEDEAVIHCTQCVKVFPDQAAYKKHRKAEHGLKRKKELKPCSEANCCISDPINNEI